MKSSVFKNRSPEKVVFKRTKTEKIRLKAIAETIKNLSQENDF